MHPLYSKKLNKGIGFTPFSTAKAITRRGRNPVWGINFLLLYVVLQLQERERQPSTAPHMYT